MRDERAAILPRLRRPFLTERELAGICGVAGLGNVPYRDGSYEYYISEPVIANDPKGVGALFMARRRPHALGSSVGRELEPDPGRPT